MRPCDNTIRKFTEFNLANHENNVLKYKTYDNVVLQDFIEGYDTLWLNSVEKHHNVMKLIYQNQQDDKITDHHYLDDPRMSEFRRIDQHELSIEEAINTIMYLDVYPIDLLNKVDLSSEESITRFVINYYNKIGPMYIYEDTLVINDTEET